MSDYYVRFQARCMKATKIALDIRAEMPEAPAWSTRFWVPKSLTGPDSEVFSMGHSGHLDVARWWAEQEGLVSKKPDRLPLPMKSLTSKRNMEVVIGVLRDMAVLARRGPHAEAICECGECDDDPVGFHKAEALEHAADQLAAV